MMKPTRYPKMEMTASDGPHFPSLNLPISAIPESKKWKIGGEYTLTVKVKHRSYSEDKQGGQVGFDVMGVETKPGKSKTPVAGKRIQRYQNE